VTDYMRDWSCPASGADAHAAGVHGFDERWRALGDDGAGLAICLRVTKAGALRSDFAGFDALEWCKILHIIFTRPPASLPHFGSHRLSNSHPLGRRERLADMWAQLTIGFSDSDWGTSPVTVFRTQ